MPERDWSAMVTEECLREIDWLWLQKNAWERLIGYVYRRMPERDWSAMVIKECLREIDRLWLQKNAWERLIGYGYRGMPARDWSAMVTKECLREIDISFNNLRCLGIVIFKRKYIE
jgi:hypothetical protein